MLTKRFTQCFRPAELQLASAALMGQRATFRIDRTNPIEEMYLVLDVTVNATGVTFSSATTPQIVDNILGMVKRFQFMVTESANSTQRPVVDCSGAGLFEFNLKVGTNIDRAMKKAIALSQGTGPAANTKIRLAYRVPLVHPMIGEPLREYCLLPVHTYPVDPIINIDFAGGTDWQASNNISAVVGHLFIVRRIMSDAQTQQILSKGGFLRQDLIETAYTQPLGTSGDQLMHLPLSGQYSTLLFRQYLGGATLSRNVIDQTTTFGTETVWQLRQGTTPLHEWRWKDLEIFAENSFQDQDGAPYVGIFAGASSGATSTTIAFDVSPAIEGALVSTSNYVNPASNILQFLGDGVETAVELGGLLDADGPIRAGQNLDLYGQIASVATNASVLYVVGHRFYGNLAAWQAATL